MNLQRIEKEEKFLNNVAYRLGRARMNNVTSPTWKTYPWDHLYKEFTHNDFLEQFMNNLKAVNGHVKIIKRDEVIHEIEQLIDEYQMKQVVAWDDPRLQSFALEEQLSKKVEYRIWNPSSDHQELIHFTKNSQLGITYAEMGLSETGTIVLFNQGGNGRSVSLLPEIHLVIFPKTQIVPRITQALQRIGKLKREEGQLPPLINFITGPSRTSDIEMVLTVGVHGPRELYVFLLDE